MAGGVEAWFVAFIRDYFLFRELAGVQCTQEPFCVSRVQDR